MFVKMAKNPPQKNKSGANQQTVSSICAAYYSRNRNRQNIKDKSRKINFCPELVSVSVSSVFLFFWIILSDERS